jgi:hypothetical protein
MDAFPGILVAPELFIWLRVVISWWRPPRVAKLLESVAYLWCPPERSTVKFLLMLR